MADLTITVEGPSGASGPTPYRVDLVDAEGELVTGYTSTGVLISTLSGSTAADGTATVDVTPNEDIDPANTYYRVTLGERAFLIVKAPETETLNATIVTTPEALGSYALLGTLADVDTTGADDGDRLAYDGDTRQWAPRPGSGGAGVESVNGDSGPDVVLTYSEITTGTVPDANIASTIARDSEVTSAIAALSTVYQPLDSDLTAIAALTTTTYGRAFLALADAAAARTALGLGTAATTAASAYDAAGAAAAAQAASQPVDTDLTAIAALTTTTYGRAFLALANNAALLPILGPSGTPSSSTYLRGDGSWQTPAGGGGAVDSVNGATGTVVLDADDVGAIPQGDVVAIEVLTQSAYDALSPPAADVLYVVVG